MNVYFSTVVRKAPVSRGGELVRLDWNSKRVLARVPIVPRANPVEDALEVGSRGNSRGGRGIVLDGNHVIAAGYLDLQFFDLDLTPRHVVSDRLFAGIHETDCDDDGYLVCSTAIDAVVRVDRQGQMRQTWWPREHPELREHLGIEPACIDKEADHRLRHLATKPGESSSHLHLNAVRMCNGRPFALLNRFGVVYDLDERRVVVDDGEIVGGHNLLFVDGGMLINDTRGRRLRLYDMTGECVQSIDLLAFQPIRAHHEAAVTSVGAESHRTTRPTFVRGLCAIGPTRVLVGMSAAAIAEIDWHRGELRDFHRYSDDPACCVHGLEATGQS